MSTTGEQRRGWLARFTRIEPGEGGALAWSCLYFFFVMCGYFIVRPLRDALGAERTDEGLSLLFLLTLVVISVVNPLFGSIVARFPRRVFVPIVYHVFAAMLVGFAVLFWLHAASPHLAGLFFVWVSVFNLFAVSIFWGFMADVWHTEQGKRLFGMIAVGGTLGAVAGSSITSALVGHLGPVGLLALSALLLEGAVFAIAQLARIARNNHVPLAHHQGEEALAPLDRPTRTANAFTGLKLIATRPYLMAICGFLLLYTLSSTLLYFEQKSIVDAAYAGLPADEARAGRTAYFGRVDLAVNILTVFSQLFLSGRVMSAIGVGPSLAILPSITLAGLGAIAYSPLLAVNAAVQILRRSAEYSLVRPAREVLFTVVGRDEKYTSKSFIDTFIYRGGDALGVLGTNLGAAAGAGGIALAFAPLAAAWIGLSLWLGKRQRVLQQEVATG